MSGTNTGRLRDQWHTMTRTGLVPRLSDHAPTPAAVFAPADAARLGAEPGGLVRLASPHGACVLRVATDAGQRAGEVFVPMHWTDAFTSSGPIDRLVGAAVDPQSGQPELKATPLRVEALPVRWRGLLLHRYAMRPEEPGLHWSRAPVAAGHVLELTSADPLPAEIAPLVDRLLAAPPGPSRSTSPIPPAAPGASPRCWTGASRPACSCCARAAAPACPPAPRYYPTPGRVYKVAALDAANKLHHLRRVSA